MGVVSSARASPASSVWRAERSSGRPSPVRAETATTCGVAAAAAARAGGVICDRM